MGGMRRLVPIGLAVIVVAAAFLISPIFRRVRSPDSTPYAGDFLHEWIGGYIVRAGDRTKLYDRRYATALQHDAQVVGFEFQPDGFFPIVYPPFYYVLVSPLSALPFQTAAALWAALSLACLAASLPLLGRAARPGASLALIAPAGGGGARGPSLGRGTELGRASRGRVLAGHRERGEQPEGSIPPPHPHDDVSPHAARVPVRGRLRVWVPGLQAAARHRDPARDAGEARVALRRGHTLKPVGDGRALARGRTRSVRRLLALNDGRRRVRRSAAGIPASRALPLRLLHLARGRTDDRRTPGDARLVRRDGVVARSTPFRAARSGAPPVSGTVLRSCARDRAPEPALPHLRSHHSPAAALV